MLRQYRIDFLVVDFIEINENMDVTDQLDWRATREFSRSAHHGSLDLRSNKIVKENQDQDRGWSRDGLSCPKQVLVKSRLLLPFTKFSKVCVFSASVNFKAFFDKYFVVKSHLRSKIVSRIY